MNKNKEKIIEELNWSIEDQLKWTKNKYKLQKNNPLMYCFLENTDRLIDIIESTIYYHSTECKRKDGRIKKCKWCSGKGYWWRQPLPLSMVPAGNYERLGNEIKEECKWCNGTGYEK